MSTEERNLEASATRPARRRRVVDVSEPRRGPRSDARGETPAAAPEKAAAVDPAPALAAVRYAEAVGRGPEAAGPPPPAPREAEWLAADMKALRPHLDALMISRNAEPALDALQQLGFFAACAPEVEAMVDLGDSEWRHKDVWKHTKQVVKQSVPRLEVRWGALLHDIGKPKTRKIEEGRVTFHGHAELGARMFRRKTARRLAMEGALKDRVHFLILYHLRPSSYDPSWTDAAVRRFYKQMGEGLRDLLDLGRADITTKRPEKRRRGVRNISALGKRIRELRSEDEKPAALPKGLGDAISAHFGVPKSKRLGDLIKALMNEVERGEVARGAEYAVYLAHLESHRARFGLDEG
ncbi:MAG: HDIG domain-containing metalloprotein [Myxococcota bacterium]